MHTLEQHFQASQKGVDKFMSETILVYLTDYPTTFTREDQVKLMIILSIFGYEKNFKTVQNLIKDIFITNEKFEVNKDVVSGRIGEKYRDGNLDFFDNKGELRLCSYKKGNIFGSHVYYDWKSKINSSYNLRQILDGIVELLYGESYGILVGVISDDIPFKEKYKLVSAIPFLSHFRSIFLFDLIKVNHYFSQGNIQINLSKDIGDYIIERDYTLFKETVKSYLLSSYNTLAYNKTDSDSLEMIKLKYGGDTNFIFYLEDALCWYGKELKGLNVGWRFQFIHH